MDQETKQYLTEMENRLFVAIRDMVAITENRLTETIISREDRLVKVIVGSCAEQIQDLNRSLSSRLDVIDTRLGSVERQLTLNNELLSPFIKWSHQVEEEIIRFASELAQVKARVDRLENPPQEAA